MLSSRSRNRSSLSAGVAVADLAAGRATFPRPIIGVGWVRAHGDADTSGVRWRWCPLLPSGNLDAKDRAAAIRIVEANAAPQSLDDLFDDAQPKAGAALLTRVRVIGLGKLVKDSRLEFLGNAVAMVAHGDQDLATPAFGRNHDILAPRGEFDRVGEKIGDDLHEPIRMGADHPTSTRRPV